MLDDLEQTMIDFCKLIPWPLYQDELVLQAYETMFSKLNDIKESVEE